ncbi:MAG: hypothetical protein ACK56I_34620, partial [bacterium]
LVLLVVARAHAAVQEAAHAHRGLQRLQQLALALKRAHRSHHRLVARHAREARALLLQSHQLLVQSLAHALILLGGLRGLERDLDRRQQLLRVFQESVGIA